jgi:uncharacterized protein
MMQADSPRASFDPAPRTPVRTCVGCRQRADRSVLLRVVAVQEEGEVLAVPDLRRSLPGRGAWLHLDPGCLEQAERRKAFGRALRVSTRIDLAPVATLLEQQACRHDRPGSALSDGAGSEQTESGFDADEHPMSTQR